MAGWCKPLCRTRPGQDASSCATLLLGSFCTASGRLVIKTFPTVRRSDCSSAPHDASTSVDRHAMEQGNRQFLQQAMYEFAWMSIPYSCWLVSCLVNSHSCLTGCCI